MKTISIKTVSLFILLGLLGFSASGYSQDRKLTRQERKEVRKTELQMNYYILYSLLNVRAFVLQPDYLQNIYGERVPVTSNLNFIKVDRSTGILQTGSLYDFGSNGVGSVTAEGTIDSWQIFKNDKKLSYVVHFSLSTNIGHYDVMLNVSFNTRATATINGLYPGKLTWDGGLVTIDNSRVFKGQMTI